MHARAPARWSTQDLPRHSVRNSLRIFLPRPTARTLRPKSAPRSKPQSPNSWPRRTFPESRSPWSKTENTSGPTASALPISRTTLPPANTRSTAWHRFPSRSRRSAPCNSGERGQLDLDAPIQKYCPAFPVKQAPITTREVMGHLGGIRHYKTDSPDEAEVGNTKHFDNPIQAGHRLLQERSPGRRPRNSFSLLHPGLHAGRLCDGRCFRSQVSRLHAPECSRSRRHGAHPSRRSLCHHPLPHPLLSANQIGHGRRMPTSSTPATKFPAAAGCRRRKTWPGSKSPS